MAKRRKKPVETGAEGTLVIKTLEQFKALAHPLRQRIFERLAIGTHTAKQVALQLGEKPTRLYHHVATLERAKLIQLVRTRAVRGATEKYYRAAGRRIEIDPSVFGDQDAKTSFALAGSGIIDGILTNLRRDLAALLAGGGEASGEAAGGGEQASLDEAIVAQVELRGDKEQIAEWRARLDSLLRELSAASEDDPENAELGDQAERRRLVIAWYPVSGSES